MSGAAAVSIDAKPHLPSSVPSAFSATNTNGSSAAAILAKLSATLSGDCTPPTFSITWGVFMCSSQTARSPGSSRRSTSRPVAATMSAIQQPGSERGMVGQDARATGPLESRQRFHHQRVAFARPGTHGGFDHRVFAADLVGEYRDFETFLHPPHDVEIGQPRLDHHAVGTLGQIERDFAKRFVAVRRIHLVGGLVALEQT